MHKPTAQTALIVILALLLGLGGAMLYRGRVERYVVECERAPQLACDLQWVSSDETRRWRVPLDNDAAAIVRLRPQRRGVPRVFLYLTSAAGETFAAEFEGRDAEASAHAAAARLNEVLKGSTTGIAHIEAAPPAIYRWMAWGMLGVTEMMLLAILVKSRAPAATQRA